MLSSFFNRTKNHEAFLWVTLGPLTVVELMYHLSTHSIIRYSVVLVPPRLLLLVVLLHLLFCIFHLTIPDPIPLTVCCSERVSVFPTASALYVYTFFVLHFGFLAEPFSPRDHISSYRRSWNSPLHIRSAAHDFILDVFARYVFCFVCEMRAVFRIVHWLKIIVCSKIVAIFTAIGDLRCEW